MAKLPSEDLQRGSHLSACMVELYDKRLWTDIKFHCKSDEGGEAIHAHKIVLAARSPVFQAMFFGVCAEGKDEVELKDKDKPIFLLFLRYLYCDTVILTEENAFPVLEMAHYYQVSSLIQTCTDYLATVITPSNACETLTFARFYNLTSLKDACCSFIDNHAEQVIQSEGFMNLSDDCLLYILKGDTLYAKEEDILEAADTWSRRKVVRNGMEENGTNIRKLLGESFYYLRLPTMTYTKLLDYTSRKGYFSVEEYADIAAHAVEKTDKSVSSNSCVARVSERETLTVNPQDGTFVILNDRNISFEIAVSKNVLLSNFVLGEINPYMKFPEPVYKDEGGSGRFIGEVRRYKPFNLQFDFSEYVDKVIKLTTLDRPKYTNYYLTALSEQDGLPLPAYLGLCLSGNVSIRGLECKSTFEVQQSQLAVGNADLKQPLLLKKRSTPYIVDVKLHYSCHDDITLKLRTSDNTQSICNKTGNIKISNVSGDFAGIRSVGFVNFSNRDVEKQDTDSEINDEENKEIE